MSGGKTPGQAAYEAWWATAEGVPATPDVTYDQDAEAWEAAAIAGNEKLRAELNRVRDELAAVTAERDELKARLEDGGAEHPSCDAHRWWAVVKHYGSFAYGFAATQDGLRVFDDVDEFEHAKAEDFG